MSSNKPKLKPRTQALVASTPTLKSAPTTATATTDTAIMLDALTSMASAYGRATSSEARNAISNAADTMMSYTSDPDIKAAYGFWLNVRIKDDAATGR